MTTALYRISSNEVLKISVKDQSFSDRDTAVFGVLIDPATPDGTEVREQTDDLGPLRELGFAKIADTVGNDCHNAIQVEIDTFAAAEEDDENVLDATQAQSLLLVHPQFRKMMTAFSDILKDEINLLRQRNVQLQNDIAAAANNANAFVGDLKASVAAYPVQTDRTLAQLKTQIRNRISKDD